MSLEEEHEILLVEVVDVMHSDGARQQVRELEVFSVLQHGPELVLRQEGHVAVPEVLQKVLEGVTASVGKGEGSVPIFLTCPSATEEGMKETVGLSPGQDFSGGLENDPTDIQFARAADVERIARGGGP